MKLFLALIGCSFRRKKTTLAKKTTPQRHKASTKHSLWCALSEALQGRGRGRGRGRVWRAPGVGPTRPACFKAWRFRARRYSAPMSSKKADLLGPLLRELLERRVLRGRACVAACEEDGARDVVVCAHSLILHGLGCGSPSCCLKHHPPWPARWTCPSGRPRAPTSSTVPAPRPCGAPPRTL